MSLAIAVLRDVVFADGNLCGTTPIPVGEAVRRREDVVAVDQGSTAEELLPLPQDDGEGEALEMSGCMYSY